MSAAEPTAWPPPRVIHWRRAVLVLAALGAIAYFGGGTLLGAEVEGVNPMPVIMTIFYGPILCTLLFVLWYLFRGPSRWYARLGHVAAAIALAVAFVAIAHPSMQFVVAMWGVPAVAGATGIALAVLPTRFAPAAVLAAAAAAYPWQAYRIDGVTGQFQLVRLPRWSQTAEDRLASHRAQKSGAAGVSIEVPAATPADWPSFRGPKRDSVVPVEALAGWSGDKPRELWRHPVGPAWSSFVAVGDFAFTQEQRGDAEAIVCYRADTGAEVWATETREKHEDMPAGPGPRATPTVAGDKIYTLGATNVLTCFNVANGQPVWSVKLADELKATKPIFGQAVSPLVVGGLVIVSPASKEAPRLAAFDAATGALKWKAGDGAIGYSSPHLATIGGVEQVIIFDPIGFAAYNPATGKELWNYEWSVSDTEPASVQPLVLADGRIVVGGGGAGTGTRCVRPKLEGDKWTVEEVWNTKKFTPKFNDSVVVGDYLYGLDNSMVCISLKDGKRVWKDGKYGAGQLLLGGGKLLVISEDGKLACVEPSPTAWKELWRFDALQGKTWNHMAVARGRLLVRNAEEAAAFDLTAK